MGASDSDLSVHSALLRFSTGRADSATRLLRKRLTCGGGRSRLGKVVVARQGWAVIRVDRVRIPLGAGYPVTNPPGGPDRRCGNCLLTESQTFINLIKRWRYETTT